MTYIDYILLKMYLGMFFILSYKSYTIMQGYDFMVHLLAYAVT